MDDIRSQVDVAQLEANRQQYIGRLLLQAARICSVHATEKLQARGHQGLSLAHTTLLAHLDLGGTRITTLAERAGMTKQAMGQLVRELEERGYVSRKDDPTDQRATLVTFTEAGWQFLLDAAVVKHEIESEYAELLGTAQLEALRSMLRRISGASGAPPNTVNAPDMP